MTGFDDDGVCANAEIFPDEKKDPCAASEFEQTGRAHKPLDNDHFSGNQSDAGIRMDGVTAFGLQDEKVPLTRLQADVGIGARSTSPADFHGSSRR